jgi:nitroreductase
VQAELSLTADQAEQFLRSRRSIRTFKERPVEREKLEMLLNMACYAPSAKNRQPWHWLVVEDRAEVRELAGMVIDWMRSIIEMDRELALNLGFVRAVEAWERGDERICRGAPHVIVVHGDKNWAFGSEDGALALDYLSLFAITLGLGTCWGGFFYSAVNQYPPLFERLNLPADHRAYGAIMVGYPKFSYKRLPKRNPLRVRWM